MILLDINSNYSDSGGGIRTYHRAKADWFNRQRRHRYYMIVPGARHAVRRIGPRTVRIDVFGWPLGRGYRLLLDYLRVWLVVRRVRPQVVEAGDPFLSGIFCLTLRAWRLIPGLVAAFYHSDPIETWVAPWAGRGGKPGWRRWLARLASRIFYGLQRRYDVTVVASRTMQEHLRSRGVERLVHKPFGVDPIFFAVGQRQSPPVPSQNDALPPPPAARARRFLFVGRLGSDKGADLLLRVLPQVMSLPGVQLTVVGSGPVERDFARSGYERLHLRGYVRERAELAEIYSQHDVLLAPGPYETFGLAVLEAMAGGLVVVGPDRGGAADFLRELNSGFMFRAHDEADFLRAIEAAASVDLDAQSAAAQLLARRYGTWDEAIGRLIAYYETCCAVPVSRNLPAVGGRWRLDGPAAPAGREADVFSSAAPNSLND